MLIALEGVAANEFGEAVGLMRVRGADRAHFIENYLDAALGELPGSFGAGEATSGNDGACGRLMWAGMQILF
jgi:hypothetical protein